MRIVLHSPYLDTLGGGERYLATLAEGFARKGNQVDFFWDDPTIIKKLMGRFDLDLSNVGTRPNVFGKKIRLLSRLALLRNYDFAIYLSDGSIPTPLAKRNILHFQVPFILKDGRRLSNKLKLAHYLAIVVNSKFTKKYIDETYGISSQVIYPPCDFSFFRPPAGRREKENIILSVGRFSKIFGGKKQEVLIDAFKNFCRKYPDWRLILAGGSQDGKYVEKLREITNGIPVKVLVNLSGDNLRELYAKAKIYWHAAGYGEDLERYPERAEHFGISVCEAMAAGCVPAVFSGGGLTEIIDHGRDGFLWNSKEDLFAQTTRLVKDANLLEKLSMHARSKAKRFSKDTFISEFEKIIR